MYNAHLEVIHSAVANNEEAKDGGDDETDGLENLSFTSFGGASSAAGLSRAEETTLAKRVSGLTEICLL